MTPYVRELRDKQKTTNQSLVKIETGEPSAEDETRCAQMIIHRTDAIPYIAAYGLSVRGAEYANFIDLRNNGDSYRRENDEDD